jgi:hypothetical protein
MMKTIHKRIQFLGMLLAIICAVVACSDDEACGYEVEELIDCPAIGLNIGDACSVNGDGNLNGTVNDVCECIQDFTIISECPGFMQNADFEIVTGDPNATIDNDIDLATGWGPLWQTGSLADLFDQSTTNFGAGCFTMPTPLSGVFAGMWVENNPNSMGSAGFREGFFNEMTATILPNTGTYNLSFDHANMSTGCGFTGDIKVGVYGVNYSLPTPLPANPTGVGVPTNIDLFGAANTVLLAEITIPSSNDDTWVQEVIAINTNALSLPAGGFNHIMITHTDNPLPDFGRLFMGFDNFCIINE